MNGIGGRGARWFLLVFIVTAITTTFIHDPLILAMGLVLVLLLSGSACLSLMRRALLTILLFNSVVSLSYIIASLIRGDVALRWLLLFNMRVLLLTSMSLLFTKRVNPFAALSFSPTLLYLLTIAYSQTLTFRRLFQEFQMARRSRFFRRPRLRDLYQNGAVLGYFFFAKSMRNATEITQAMTSRGFFNDQG